MLARCLEASIEELQELVRLEASMEPSFLYTRGLLAYLTSDLEELAQFVTRLKGSAWQPLLEARYHLRRKDVQALRRSLTLFPEKTEDAVLDAEAAFVRALACDLMGDPAQSVLAYDRAAGLLERAGMRRKALKARYNALSAESWSHEATFDLAKKFREVARSAGKLRDRQIRGLAFLAVSQQFSWMHAHRLAFRFARLAERALQSDSGSRNLSAALAQKAYALVALGRRMEAQLAIEEVSVSAFEEYRFVTQILKGLLEGRVVVLASPELKMLSPVWRARHQTLQGQSGPAAQLGEIEQKLIEALSRGPRTKERLSCTLFGELLDEHVRARRLEDVIYRVRIKFPDLVVFEGGVYRLGRVTTDPSSSSQR